MSHSSYSVGATLPEGKKMILKKDVYQNEEGEIKESSNGLPKGWRKGKLLARAGHEISDAQAKEWGIGKVEKKAVEPKENKAK